MNIMHALTTFPVCLSEVVMMILFPPRLANYTRNSRSFLVSRNEAVRDRDLNPLMALYAYKDLFLKNSIGFSRKQTA